MKQRDEETRVHEGEPTESGELYRPPPGIPQSTFNDVPPLPSPRDQDPGGLRVIAFTLPPWTKQYARVYRERVRAAEERNRARTDAGRDGEPVQTITVRPVPVTEVDSRLGRTQQALQHERGLTNRLVVGLVAALVIALVALLRRELLTAETGPNAAASQPTPLEAAVHAEPSLPGSGYSPPARVTQAPPAPLEDPGATAARNEEVSKPPAFPKAAPRRSSGSPSRNRAERQSSTPFVGNMKAALGKDE